MRIEIRQYEKVEVVFLKKECDTAVIEYNGVVCRIKQRFIYGTLGQLVLGEKVFVKKWYIEPLSKLINHKNK